MKKVSLYIDEKLWVKFKEAVLRKHGTLRKLSDEVERLLRSSMVDEELERGFEGIGVEMRGLAGPEEVKRGRPKLRGPPSESIVREMRGERLENIP